MSSDPLAAKGGTTMRCPTLSELPFSPPGKTGWPWTEESPQLPDRMSNGKPWPKISIVTPNYNYSQFIEETIRSVLLQGYPDLEYIVIDGASTDNSMQVIKKYEKWFTYCISERDQGQSHAINKGFKVATGNICAWLNSDDLYNKGSFFEVANSMVNPDRCVIFGDCKLIDANKNIIGFHKGKKVSREQLIQLWNQKYHMAWQPEVFFKKICLDKCGYLDEDNHYFMDYDLWMRFSEKYSFDYLPKTLAFFRFHEKQKGAVSNKDFIKYNRYYIYVSKKYWTQFPLLTRIRFRKEGSIFLKRTARKAAVMAIKDGEVCKFFNLLLQFLWIDSSILSPIRYFKEVFFLIRCILGIPYSFFKSLRTHSG